MIDRDAEIERAANRIVEAWPNGGYHDVPTTCERFATAAITPLLDRIERLEGAMTDAIGDIENSEQYNAADTLSAALLAQSQPGVKP